MAHQTFKVCILNGDEDVENFYIKHYIDLINPIFNRFKNQVFTRNPAINTTNLKIYWIDAENDKILVSCEEDFRLYLEQGKGRKIFFSSSNGNNQQSQNEKEDDSAEVQMEIEDGDHKCDRRCRKGHHKDEEKKRRHAKKLAEKLKHYEDTYRTEEEKARKKQHSDKRECRSTERLERARRRVEQIRSIIGSFDPANLNSSNEFNEPSTDTSFQHASTSTASTSSAVQPSPEIIRLLSNAIAGCLHPCSGINKVLTEVFALVPQIIPLPEENNSTTTTAAPENDQQEQSTEIPQQSTEVLKQSTATNTSIANTPIPVQQANYEIQAMFKEVAKELENINEIAKNNKMVESSMSSSSSNTGVTQIERVFQNITDSAISDSTVIMSMNPSQMLINSEKQQDVTDSYVGKSASADDEEFNILSPPKMNRSRESSIEVHDVNSSMSDDSRDWTILSVDHDQDEISMEQLNQQQRVVDPKTGAIPKASLSVETPSQIDAEIQVNNELKSVSTETQTPPSLLSGISQQQQYQDSVQKSIDIVQKSIEFIQKSMESATVSKPAELKIPEIPAAAVIAEVPAQETVVEKKSEIPTVVVAEKKKEIPVAAIALNQNAEALPSQNTASINQPSSYGLYPNLKPTAPIAEQSQANLNAQKPAPSKVKFAPAVIVYDPNPKINAAVHTMMQMGFSNEDNWLTQLLINVDGDIPKALNFLTPQPKNKKQ